MFQYIFDNNYMQNYSGAMDSRSVGSLAGRSIKILNFTNYDVQVYMAGSQLIDVIPAFQYIVMDNQPDLSLTITGTVSSNYKYMNPYVAVRSSDAQIPYEIGSLIHNLVTNNSSQPVPTSSNYYGSGADGVFNSTGNVTQNNPSNLPAIYNYTSFTLNSGHTLSFANQAKYVVIYSQGDITINGTLYAANGMSNITQGNGLTINGKSVPNAGNGGNGGNGGSLSSYTVGTGGTGGTGNCFASGCGGGGGGGAQTNAGGNGGSGGTGYGTATPPGYSNVGASYQTEASANPSILTAANPTPNTATLCLVAAGTITINGTIYAKGGNGQNGASGKNYNGVSGLTNTWSGSGGNSGTNAGGNGGYYAGSNSQPYAGGGGSGGAGGGVVFMFAGGSIQNNGTINVNGGTAGSGGQGSTIPTYNGNSGQAGSAGTVVSYQMGGNLQG